MVEDGLDFSIYEWRFQDNYKERPRQASELKFGRVKIFLYENLRRCVSRHDLNECFKLLKILPKETTFDPYVFIRFIFILVESNRTEKLNKNVIIYLESLLTQTDLCKPDVFVEFLAYFMKYNRIADARELFNQRHRHMERKRHRDIPFVNTNLRCYEFLLNYLEWRDELEKELPIFDLSIQGWIVNAINCLKTTKGNYEYFVIRVLEVLLRYGFTKKAYLFSREFLYNNPNNIGAQLLHFNLLRKLSLDHQEIESNDQSDMEPMDCDLPNEQREKNHINDLEDINNFSQDMKSEIFNTELYPIDEDRKTIIGNLRRLDYSRTELMDLTLSRDNALETLKDAFDSLEIVDEVKNLSRWERLKQVIDYILITKENGLIMDACFLWQTRYKRYWKSIDFPALAGEQISNSDKELISGVIMLIHKKLNRRI